MLTAENIFKIFGPAPGESLRRLDRGESRADIHAATGGFVALEDASISVAHGEILALMGRSGSGKSTLLRCLNGLSRPDRGRVAIDDGGVIVDLSSSDLATQRRLRQTRVAMVLQNGALLPWRSVGDNVALSLEVRGARRSEIDRIVDEKLELVGLLEWRDEPVSALSGGMQQRVGLARALATDSDILLMDEPFSALDPLLRARMQEELLDLQRKLQKAIVFVTHDLDEALRLGSRIALLDAGRVVQVGTAEEIVMCPKDDYVRAFVSHINPLNVLRGRAFMRPLAALERAAPSGDIVLLDDSGEFRCRLGTGARPIAFAHGHQESGAVAHHRGMDVARDGLGLIASPDAPMSALIRLFGATGRPVPLVDDAGDLVGVIGEREILNGVIMTEGGRQ